VYDEAKRFAEALVTAYHKVYAVDTKIVRIFNTYGPRMRADDGRVVPTFIAQALRGEPLSVFGDGKQTRSFCYVSDLVAGIYRLLTSAEHLPTNLGSPDERTILDVAHLVRELTGAAVDISYFSSTQDDPRVRRPDITKARQLLEWEPRVPLEEGLAATIAYFREALAGEHH
jgi:dTDP-glucose 4,6-dehydratase